ncbi:hypothetical protein B0I72DRAFT_141274 [Yarrowia lipolytica]|jgi:hypothetical protein|uniref:YALI0E19426p n=2 Tax=Yarrowia lipolytica TaxID=4952 RepID=Q6C5B7_YARLI|nr:YALI0E19426p [Yarrowia lipolytica CLIB122]AOW05652.1 hypothetical protein YALI1_E23256g [Yarrowia lipolytica]KAB8281587.1 hypothetical protein BKA91DRAFT_139942 [Yarrowia lipolytica]KAE8171063.1 hypothetical protein BKA90DRAFT_139709 [Yarrowia lipolytica]KAJ8057121.1 hypothetical protein LXG23DRAFT_53824 [Yarrowia lipolytica]QNQ00059.1 Hypothetical protein YALI2_E01374g [Yarrowia lipolytica]|eukprot:XP_504145.1 YALI0E19426p [Yarrowia lipolytica CLIB122]
MLLTSISALALASLTAAQGHGEQFAQSMGPVAFLWPQDRPWADDDDNTGPCGAGASAAIHNRTNFPLTGGHIALVAKDEAWGIRVRISYQNNPTSEDDFEDIFTGNISAEADKGHACYQFPDIPNNVREGQNGTIQLEYNAIDGTQNISHFVCADVYFVERNQFQNTGFSAMCFNTTEGEIAPDSTPTTQEVADGKISDAPSGSGARSSSAATSAAATSESKNAGSAVKAVLGGAIGAAGIALALI